MTDPPKSHRNTEFTATYQEFERAKGKRHFSRPATSVQNENKPISIPSFQNYIVNEPKIKPAEEQLMKLQIYLS